jgi:hypothetical protein
MAGRAQRSAVSQDEDVITLASVLVAAVTLGVGCALVVRRRLAGVTPWLRRTAAALTAVVVLGVAVEGWAHLMVDRSGVARAVAWMEADTGDLRRFPSRPIEAAKRPLPLQSCASAGEVLDLSVRTDGGRVQLRGLLEASGTSAFLVLTRRCLAEEYYGQGSTREQLQTSFSMAKSFLSTLVGIAIARGDLEGLDEPVTSYLPELAERDDRYHRITLRHLVTMASGLHYEEHGLPWSDDAVTYYSPDLRSTALSARVQESPGRRWHYNNYNPLLMGLVLERATGMSVAAYMERHLWRPMRAEHDASWSLDSTRSGFEKMESGINATARDYARFGYLFAHRGRVAGRQVVPAAWVSEATAVDASGDPNPGYQYWWWVDDARDGRFYARGNFGQFIYVDSRTDLVLVRTGRDFGISDWPSVLRQVADQLRAGPR